MIPIRLLCHVKEASEKVYYLQGVTYLFHPDDAEQLVRDGLGCRDEKEMEDVA